MAHEIKARPRCPTCDAPEGTETDGNEHGDDPLAGDMCWRLGGRCVRPPVDWRERCQYLDTENTALVKQLTAASDATERGAP